MKKVFFSIGIAAIIFSFIALFHGRIHLEDKTSQLAESIVSLSEEESNQATFTLNTVKQLVGPLLF